MLEDTQALFEPSRTGYTDQIALGPEKFQVFVVGMD